MKKEPDNRTWQERRDGHDFLYISPSILNTVSSEEACYRKWWFAKVRRLKTETKSATGVGTALHAIAKRFYDADDRGYDRVTGQPVELFPHGWHVVYEEFDDTIPPYILTPEEQKQARAFVKDAIETGIWARVAGRVAEEEHDFDAGSVTCGDKTINIKVRCSMDLHLPSEIQDHKTTKSSKWLKSAAKLKEDNQALLYSWLHFKQHHEQVVVKFTHNQFIKKNGKVKQTSCVITREDTERWYEHVFVPKITELVRVRQKAQQWYDIPDPANKERACRAFGGCPFMSICNGQITPEQYETKMNNYFVRLCEDRNNLLKKEQPMLLPQNNAQQSPVGGGSPVFSNFPVGGQSPLAGNMPVNNAMPPQPPVQQQYQAPVQQQYQPPVQQQEMPQQQQYQAPATVEQDVKQTAQQAPATETPMAQGAILGAVDAATKEKSGFTVLMGCMMTKGFAACRNETGGQKRSIINGENLLALIYDYIQQNWDNYCRSMNQATSDIMQMDDFKRQKLVSQAFAENFASQLKTSNVMFRKSVNHGDMGALQQVCCMYADTVFDAMV